PIFGQYKALKALVAKEGFPDKPVVIGEVGWTSNGDRRQYAHPSIAGEAHFLRDWFNVAERDKIDYYVMEAIDQPWKEANEGRAGAYWGVFNANREQKFAFTGTVIEDPNWPWKAGFASLLALGPMFWFARHFIRFRALGLAFFLGLIQVS